MRETIEVLIDKYTQQANKYLKKANECENHIMCNEYMQYYYIYRDFANELKLTID